MSRDTALQQATKIALIWQRPVYSPTTGFRNTPIRSISTSTTSPACKNTGGLRAAPTPGGVPVKITSPGASVHTSETYDTSSSDGEDELDGAGVLHGAAVDAEADSQVANVTGFVGGNELGPERREGVERFAQQPLAAGLSLLPVAGRDIVAAGVARDVIESLIDRDVAAAASDDGDQLGFVIDFVAEPRQDDRVAVGRDRGGEFAENYRLGRRLLAGFARVVGVVEPDANHFLRRREPAPTTSVCREKAASHS